MSRVLKLKRREYLQLSKDFGAEQFLVSKEEYYEADINRDFRSDWKLYNTPIGVKNLKSVNYWRDLTNKERDVLRRSVKYIGEVKIDWKDEEDVKPSDGPTLSPQEFLLTFRICFPACHSSHSLKRKGERPKPSQELIVPGCLTLDQIRDRIICPQDYQDIQEEISDNPEIGDRRTSDVYPSAMFYLGNNFYIDGRNLSFEDYSTPILEWGRKNRLEFGHTYCMENTTVDSLCLRLGYPYLYVHQGSCEHLVIITDARLVSKFDLLAINDYPLLASIATLKGKFCYLCSRRVSKFIVKDCEILPYDTAYLCNTCYMLYLHDGDKKICSYKARAYVDRVALL